MKLSTFSMLIIVVLVVTGCSQEVSFRGVIKPILDKKCLSCHDGKGEGVVQSGFNVSSYQSLMKGTRLGPVIVAGSSVSSTLYQLISHQADPKIQMPPHHDESFASKTLEPLSTREIDAIARWIDEGAKDN